VWGDIVIQERISLARGFAFALTSVVTLAVLQQGFLFPLARQVGAAMGTNLAVYELETDGWTNPVTNSRVLLRDWKLATTKDETASKTWTWSRSDGSTLTVFYGIGNYTSTLADIATALRARPDGYWRYAGSGRTEYVNDTYFWEASRELGAGTIPGLIGPTFHVLRLFQTERGMWFVLYMAPQSTGSSEVGTKAADAIMRSAVR
jgi:hypothetical protein